MKKIRLAILFLLIISNYGYAQTVVKLLLPNNCAASITTVNEVKPNELANLEIYPNPNNGNFTLKIKLKKLIDKAIINIFNTLGQIIYSKEISFNSLCYEEKLNIKEITPGIYYLRLNNEKAETSITLIIK